MVSRVDKVRKALIREISDLIEKKIKDPRKLAMVSVVDVDISADYKFAKVFISIYGTEEERENTMKAVESSAGFIRSELGKRVKLRNTPELRFVMDDSLERGTRVSQLIDKISKGEL